MGFSHLFIPSYNPGRRASSFLLSSCQRSFHIHTLVSTSNFWLLTSTVRPSSLLYTSLGLFDRDDTLTSYARFKCNTTPDSKPITFSNVSFAYSDSCQKLMLTSESWALLCPATRHLTTLQWHYLWLSWIVQYCTRFSTTTTCTWLSLIMQSYTCSSTTTSDYRRCWLKISESSALWRRKTLGQVDIANKVIEMQVC